MNGDTDKRMVVGSDRPCEGVATSLRFPSKTGSFTPGNYGSEAGPPNEQPDSPIKTSPVSERIKALEALAAQKKQPDFRTDRSFSHFRDHHNEKSLNESSKSPFEKITPTKTTSEVPANQESPQSPFEILGDFRQINDFEETEKWMKAHLPPVPNFDAVDLVKGTLTSDGAASKEEKETDIVIPNVPAAFAGVPDAFMDSPVKVPKQKDTFCDTQRQPSIEEKSEFDLTFLPTAYMWDQHEKSGAEHSTDPDSILPPSSAAPTGIGSSPSVQDISTEKKPTCSGDIEPPEASEAESSGESEDTVIEDGAPVPSETCDPTVLNDGTTTLAPDLVEVKETPPPKSERKLMQVPTINVIETDEPNYSDEEMELESEEVKDYEVVKELSTEVSKSPEPESEDSENEPTRTRPLETEFIEGYSPPSSPVDSDTDHSPKHKITECLSGTIHQESTSKPEELFNQNILKDSPSNLFQAQFGNEETSSSNDEKMDFADNDDEWSDEAQDVLVKTCKTDIIPKEATTSTQSELDEKSNMPVEAVNIERDIVSRTSFMQDEIYDRQSFDNDYNASSALDGIDGTGQNNAKERFLSGSSQAHDETLIANTAQNEGSEDDQNLGDLISGNEGEPIKKSVSRDYPQDPYSYFQSEPVRTINEQDLSKKMSPDSDSENMGNEDSLPGKRNAEKHQQDSKVADYVPDDTTNTHVADSERSDSFVDFMRECLKSTQDEVEDAPQTEDSPSKNKIALPSSQFPPTMVMDLEQEQLTISALKELGGSQEEEEEMVSLLPKVPGQDNATPTSLSIKQCPVTSVSHPACSQSNLVLDSSYSKEVEAIDKWVAEAYHLAEHVLTAILTHLSGNTSSLWAIGLLISCSLFKQIFFLTCTLHLHDKSTGSL